MVIFLGTFSTKIVYGDYPWDGKIIFTVKEKRDNYVIRSEESRERRQVSQYNGRITFKFQV